jgi:hypothetical protein
MGVLKLFPTGFSGVVKKEKRFTTDRNLWKSTGFSPHSVRSSWWSLQNLRSARNNSTNTHSEVRRPPMVEREPSNPVNSFLSRGVLNFKFWLSKVVSHLYIWIKKYLEWFEKSWFGSVSVLILFFDPQILFLGICWHIKQLYRVTLNQWSM